MFMMVSTRGRYALRVLLDLAEHKADGYVPMKEVAARQSLSLKYLEQIMPLLTKGNFVEGLHGKGGGYRLKRDASDIRVGEVLRLCEGDLAPVACLKCDADACERAADCKTLPMWKEFDTLVNNYFDGITLSALLQKSEKRA